MTNEKNLRRLLDHKYRLAIVIFGTFGIGLVTLLPLADEYQDLQQRRTEAETALAEGRLVAHDLEACHERVRAQVAQLEKLEARAVSSRRVDEFRNRMVEMVRESGCQIRRIQVGAGQARKWLKNDDPLQSTASGTDGKNDSGFQLESQTFTLSVTGSLPKLKELLAALHAQHYLAHTKSFSLRPAGQDGKEASLDVELWLFDLARKKPVSA
jgi:hypothetical protein